MHSSRMRTSCSLPYMGEGSLSGEFSVWLSLSGGSLSRMGLCLGVSVRESPQTETPGRNMGPETETPRRNMGPETETPMKEHGTR